MLRESASAVGPGSVTSGCVGGVSRLSGDVPPVLPPGNCVIIKPSEVSSCVEKLIAELLPSYLDKVRSCALPWHFGSSLMFPCTMSPPTAYSLTPHGPMFIPQHFPLH